MPDARRSSKTPCPARKPSSADSKHSLAYLREGDTLVVWKLDPLGRPLRDLITIVADLEQRGIRLKRLQESIDTTTPGGRLIFHVFAAVLSN
jgi:DNA invertase Pin-like site-specific DNA recombinase